MTYYLVILWTTSLTNLDMPKPYPLPRIEVTQSMDSACNLAMSTKIERARIYRMEIKTKDCRAVADPNWVDCVIQDGSVEVKPGECHPKSEFIFTEKP